MSQDLNGSLLCICNPIIDISADVKPDLLQKYDLKPSNAILAEAQHLPLYKELEENYKVQYIAGGAGQNAIRATQWLLQVPGATSYIGCVGDDENAKKMREIAHREGVNVQYMVDPTTPTGTCAVLITDTERSMVANLAAANNYKKTHFDSAEIQAIVQKAKVIYVTGFFLTVSVDTMLAVGETCLQNNKTFLLNLSAPFLIDFFNDQLTSVMPYVDIVFGNEHEFAALAKKYNYDSDLKVVAEKLAAWPKKNEKRSRIVIVTQGSESTIIFNNGKATTVEVPKVPSSEIVDVNGAGDSFVGGFLALYAQGRPIEDCVRAGHYVAGVTIRTSGTNFEGKKPELKF